MIERGVVTPADPVHRMLDRLASTLARVSQPDGNPTISRATRTTTPTMP